MYLKATCSVARIFTNPIIAINNFGYAHIRVIRATEQVAILFIEQDSCRFVRFVGKKIIRGKNKQIKTIGRRFRALTHSNMHFPKIVFLDGYTVNPGDLGWKKIEALGTLMVYDRTAPEDVLTRAA